MTPRSRLTRPHNGDWEHVCILTSLNDLGNKVAYPLSIHFHRHGNVDIRGTAWSYHRNHECNSEGLSSPVATERDIPECLCRPGGMEHIEIPETPRRVHTLVAFCSLTNPSTIRWCSLHPIMGVLAWKTMLYKHSAEDGVRVAVLHPARPDLIGARVIATITIMIHHATRRQVIGPMTNASKWNLGRHPCSLYTLIAATNRTRERTVGGWPQGTGRTCSGAPITRIKTGIDHRSVYL